MDRLLHTKRRDSCTVPLKNKFFLWLISRNTFLTMDNLLKKGWSRVNQCYFRGRLEIVDHLFFQCPIAEFICSVIGCCFGSRLTPTSISDFQSWAQKILPSGNQEGHWIGFGAVGWSIGLSRNDICFHRITITDPKCIVYRICSFLKYWPGWSSTKIKTRRVAQDRCASSSRPYGSAE
uniref:Reverse transcriptase zinc-binding domain-containing protein n=1 Tax=Arundo donax TaxID=35708 RepID=A0A0A9D1B7_ARUDO